MVEEKNSITVSHDCVVYKTAELVGKKWTIMILLEISKNKNLIRYQELKNRVPYVTGKVLSLRLKELQEEGLLKKFVDSTVVPMKCTYSLTMQGIEFIDIIKKLKAWGLKRSYNSHCSRIECKNCIIE